MKRFTCDECGKEATVFWKENVNGNVKEAHLCAECAEKKEIGKFFSESFFHEDPFASLPLFTGLFAPALHAAPSCPTCGESLDEIRESGKFGCPDCYEFFREKIDFSPFIRKGYRGSRLGTVKTETGKTEEKAPDPKDEIKTLKAKLKKAVAEEKYEEAAKYRDEIRKLEA